MRTIATLCAATLLGLAAGAPAPAAEHDAALAALKAAKTLHCTFDTGRIGEWREARFAVTTDDWPRDAIYNAIDLAAGTARVIGSNSGADVSAADTPSGITFIERTRSGNTAVTTVFAAYCGGEGRFCAVMSRHMLLPGGPLASQYHGTCTPG